MLLTSIATLTGKARKDAKPGSSGSKRQLEEGNSGSAGLDQQGRANNGAAGLEQQGRGNKRSRLGPTEQLRVVVRQILAGSLTAGVLCKSINQFNQFMLIVFRTQQGSQQTICRIQVCNANLLGLQCKFVRFAMQIC